MEGNKSKKREKPETSEISEIEIAATEKEIEPAANDIPSDLPAIEPPAVEANSEDTKNKTEQGERVMSVGNGKKNNEQKYFYRYRIDKRRLKANEGVIINSKEALIRMFVVVENKKLISRKEAAEPTYRAELDELKAIEAEIKAAQGENRPVNAQVIKDEDKRKKFEDALKIKTENERIDLSMFPASKKLQMTPKILEEAYIHLQRYCEVEQLGERKYLVKRIYSKAERE